MARLGTFSAMHKPTVKMHVVTTSVANSSGYATLVYDLDAANFAGVPANGALDATGTYALGVVNSGASISYSSSNGGYWTKSNNTATDLITGGPVWTGTTQSYTVFLAYNVNTTSAGRLLNTGIESSPADWLMGSYGAGATGYKNVFFTAGIGDYNVDTYATPSGWRFIWGTYDNASGTMKSYIASATENNTSGPSTYYKIHTGMSGAHAFNQLRLFSRGTTTYTGSGSEVQTGSIGFVKVYNGEAPVAQIQSQWSTYHTRFGI